MTIRLNGEPHELDEPLSLSALLARLSIDARRVAVEHNLVVVKRSRYDDTMINDGDEIEVVNFVGGGQVDCRLRIVECRLAAPPEHRRGGAGLPSADCRLLGLTIDD